MSLCNFGIAWEGQEVEDGLTVLISKPIASQMACAQHLKK